MSLFFTMIFSVSAVADLCDIFFSLLICFSLLAFLLMCLSVCLLVFFTYNHLLHLEMRGQHLLDSCFDLTLCFLFFRVYLRFSFLLLPALFSFHSLSPHFSPIYFFTLSVTVSSVQLMLSLPPALRASLSLSACFLSSLLRSVYLLLVFLASTALSLPSPTLAPPPLLILLISAPFYLVSFLCSALTPCYLNHSPFVLFVSLSPTIPGQQSIPLPHCFPQTSQHVCIFQTPAVTKFLSLFFFVIYIVLLLLYQKVKSTMRKHSCCIPGTYQFGFIQRWGLKFVTWTLVTLKTRPQKTMFWPGLTKLTCYRVNALINADNSLISR